MKTLPLLGLFVGLLFTALPALADASPMVPATPLSDVPQESVVGCLTVQRVEKKWFRTHRTPVSSQCFNSFVAKDADNLPADVLEKQAVKLNVSREQSYVQSVTTSKSVSVILDDRPEAIASTNPDSIKPAVSEDKVVLNPGKVTEGVTSELRFFRTLNGQLTGVLDLSVITLESISSFGPDEFQVLLPRTLESHLSWVFSEPVRAVEVGDLEITLDFRVLPEGEVVSAADLNAVALK